MRSELRPALLSLALLTILTGAIYPAVVTGIAHLAFRRQAEGSLIPRDGKPVGSMLIGQPFDDPKYFWSRPSATSPAYNGAASGAANFGPMNPALTDAIKGRVATLRSADPSATGPVPVDLITGSGSGLDPHITPAAAAYQVNRVAQARSQSADRIRDFVVQYTEGRQLGFLGEARVNVLLLNLALDSLTATP
ncbi:MAG TPA: potassium-transporting ATPase subunit KdpC [Gemmatimonadales bacterium]|nr:potassium-transporting ATPase subunit KdpC [Gemmatimonadales bacterium]